MMRSIVNSSGLDTLSMSIFLHPYWLTIASKALTITCELRNSDMTLFIALKDQDTLAFFVLHDAKSLRRQSKSFLSRFFRASCIGL